MLLTRLSVIGMLYNMVFYMSMLFMLNSRLLMICLLWWDSIYGCYGENRRTEVGLNRMLKENGTGDG